MASIFDKEILTKQDLERIDRLGKLWTETKDPDKKAEYHKMAESIRQGYGYSGGADGHGFEDVNKTVVSTATAANNLNSALMSAKQSATGDIALKKADIEADGDERLRQAYVKNMQQKLGLDQALKAEGITGGMTESTRAALGNSYLNLRDDILSDVSKQKQKLDSDNQKADLELLNKIAQNQYESALSRADMLTDAEKEEYAREMAQKEYALELDKFDYQKEKDALELEYKKQRDALDRQHELQKVYASKTLKSSSGSGNKTSTDEKKQEQLKEDAWALLKKGVYHESFPAILGFSEEVLMEYADNVLSGF